MLKGTLLTWTSCLLYECSVLFFIYVSKHPKIKFDMFYVFLARETDTSNWGWGCSTPSLRTGYLGVSPTACAGKNWLIGFQWRFYKIQGLNIFQRTNIYIYTCECVCCRDRLIRISNAKFAKSVTWNSELILFRSNKAAGIEIVKCLLRAWAYSIHNHGFIIMKYWTKAFTLQRWEKKNV
jgi:hypothetical protein